MSDPFGQFVGNTLNDDRTKLVAGMAGQLFSKAG